MVEQVITKEQLVTTLKDLGVTSSMILEVHCDLSKLPYIVGGAQTVVDALLEIVGETGTILMPIEPANTNDPSAWKNPNVSCDLYDEIRENMPMFHPLYCDSKAGAVLENFRSRSDVIFSSHPKCGYAAWGRYAKLLCNRQSLHFPLAEESPSARLYELKGYVLNIGCQLEDCTCLHLAEYRSDCRPIKVDTACINMNGRRVMKRYLDLDIDNKEFNRIRPNMIRKDLIRSTNLGECEIELFSAHEAINELTAYLEKSIVYSLYR